MGIFDSEISYECHLGRKLTKREKKKIERILQRIADIAVPNTYRGLDELQCVVEDARWELFCILFPEKKCGNA